MIILDTNVLSELMKPRPDPMAQGWLDDQHELTLFVTTITLAEIRFGIAALPGGRRRAALDRAFEEGIRPMLGDRVLSFDDAASRTYAAVRTAARTAGQAMGDVDAMIAAIAQSRRFAIATRDVAPFEAAGLRVIDPFAAPRT